MTTTSEIPTPALLLDRAKLESNAAFMTGRAKQLGVQLRPHMKTAKSVDVARIATAGNFGGITVSTLAEARYFMKAGLRDITYAVGLAPSKIDEALSLASLGADLNVLTDNIELARYLISRAAGQSDSPLSLLIEIDCGDRRGGVAPDSAALLEIARLVNGRAGVLFAGVLTHAGHSYACSSVNEIAQVAEDERAAAVLAAQRIRDLGMACDTVSVGSTPTATHARHLDGVTEMRPGVYMFGDLDQVGLESLPDDRIAVSVLASVIGAYPDRLIVDAGGLALSKDTSAQRHNPNIGYGRVVGLRGASVVKANQEHGIIMAEDPGVLRDVKVGDRVRIVPNHVCMTAAAHPGYYVVNGTKVLDRWPRINGWEQWTVATRKAK
ncbi:MAG: alanine racemase [Planctomycetes bacterium]|nr:alanine racemase [Planctomycetota bacterium]